jgi:enoyl-CoA hydratase/carnithine racemase
MGTDSSVFEPLTPEDAQLLLVDVQDGIATVTMNDTKTFNSLGKKMVALLCRAIVALSRDEAVRVIVLRSAAKIFCSGANIKEFQQMSLRERSRYDNFLNMKWVFQQASKPIVCLVNGGAYGGGFELALMCDIILATKDVLFGFPEIKLGLIPGIAGTLIAKVVGR